MSNPVQTMHSSSLSRWDRHDEDEDDEDNSNIHKKKKTKVKPITSVSASTVTSTTVTVNIIPQSVSETAAAAAAAQIGQLECTVIVSGQNTSVPYDDSGGRSSVDLHSPPPAAACAAAYVHVPVPVQPRSRPITAVLANSCRSVDAYRRVEFINQVTAMRYHSHSQFH